MESSQLLNGLTQDSRVSPAMLNQLVECHKKLVARSVSNQDWTEQTQLDFELLHTVIRRNGIFV